MLVIVLLLFAGCAPVQSEVRVGFKADQFGTTSWDFAGLTSGPTQDMLLREWPAADDVFGGDTSWGLWYGAPVVSESAIFVPDTGITCLSTDGHLLWHVTLGEAASGPIVAAAPFLYVVMGERNPADQGDEQERLYCVDMATGAVRWRTGPIGYSSGIQAGPIPALANGKVYLPASEFMWADTQAGWTSPTMRGKTYIGVWDAKTGAELQKMIPDGWDMIWSGSMATCTDGETIYFAGKGAAGTQEQALLLAVRARDSRILWSRSILAGSTWFRHGTLALADDTLIFQTSATKKSSAAGSAGQPEGLLTAAFNAANGALRWQREMPSNDVDGLQFARLVVSGDMVCMPTQAGSILALNVLTGAQEWEHFFQAMTVKQWDEIAKKDVETRWNDSFLLAASTDVLYVAGEATDIVRGLRLSDGTQLWQRSAMRISGITPIMSGLLVLCTPIDKQSKARGPTRLEQWR
jgi:outer membrane protein assembly factor BamB